MYTKIGLSQSLDLLVLFLPLYLLTGSVIYLLGKSYNFIHQKRYTPRIIAFIICTFALLLSPIVITFISFLVIPISSSSFGTVVSDNDRLFGIFFIHTYIIIICYTCASIPFGLLLSKFFTNKDIQNSGSGNIGATNVLRTTGKKSLAFLTLILDFAKSFIPLLFISAFLDEKFVLLAIGLSSILGHIFPIWLNFRGGKGVATTLGVYWAYDVFLGFVATLAWIVTFVIFRYSSLSSITMVITTALISYKYGPMPNLLIIIIGLIVIVAHYQNILRLIVGDEKKNNIL